jgi:hypothetical protein
MNEILAGVPPDIRALMITFVVSFLIMLCGACLNLFRFKHGPCIFCNVSAGEGFEVVMEVRFERIYQNLVGVFREWTLKRTCRIQSTSCSWT